MRFNLVSGELENLNGYAMFYTKLDSKLGEYYAGFGFDYKLLMKENSNFDNFMFDKLFEIFPPKVMYVAAMFNGDQIINETLDGDDWDVYLSENTYPVESEKDLKKLDVILRGKLDTYMRGYALANECDEITGQNKRVELFDEIPEPTEENMRDVYRNFN
jgi:hypothetical protein